MVVDMSDLLTGLLSGCIQRGWSIRPVMLGERHMGVEPVHRRRRRPDDGGLRVGRARRLEQRHETGNVSAHIRHGVHECVPHTGLRGEVEDVCEGHDVEQLGEELGVGDVAVDDVDPGAGEERGAAALEGRVVVVVEVVEAEHAVPSAAKRGGGVAADEPRGARDEDGVAPGAPDARRRPYLLLPGGAAPGGGGRGGRVEGAARGLGRGPRGGRRGGEEEEGEEEGEGADGPEGELGEERCRRGVVVARGQAVVVVVVELRLDGRRAARRGGRAGRAGQLRRHPLDPRQCGWSLDLGSGLGLGLGAIGSAAALGFAGPLAAAVFSSGDGFDLLSMAGDLFAGGYIWGEIPCIFLISIFPSGFRSR